MTDYILKRNGAVKLVKFADGDEFLTVEEIVDDIIKHRLDAEAIDILKNESAKPLLHLSFGMWIRNSYGLWLKENPLTDHTDESYIVDGIDYNPKHADAVSAVIIEKIHQQLSGANNYDDAMKAINQE